VITAISPVVAGLNVDGGLRQLLGLQSAGEVSRPKRSHEGAAQILGSIPPISRRIEILASMCGIDWSKRHHDVAIVDQDGAVVARARVSHDITGFSQLMALLAAHASEPTTIEVAIETDQGPLVAALRAAGFVVFAINPRAVARYRERYGQAGGKSDPGDAVVLANILRTDRHAHPRLPLDSDLASAVKAVARQHQEAIWARQQAMSRLRSLLHDYYPQALVAFPNLAHRAAAVVPRAAPTPQAAQRLTPRRVVALLKLAGRRNDEGLAERGQHHAAGAGAAPTTPGRTRVGCRRHGSDRRPRRDEPRYRLA
jgi:transposase